MTALTAGDRAFLEVARTATLATIDAEGRPRLVPICFVVEGEVDGPVLWSPIDEKPKRSGDPRSLARVRDILARPDVTLLVDRWSEDWSELGWLRVTGRASLVEPDPSDATLRAVIAAMRAKHPPYLEHDLAHRPMLRIAIDSVVRWSASG
ncbi:MAG: pyridoxamine 5'-phosphate oxidase family protein [Candidatus Limnocylindrales bacterium]